MPDIVSGPNIISGRGALAQLGAIATEAGISRPAFVTTPRRRFVEEAAQALAGKPAILDLAIDHCPATLIPKARSRLAADIDGLIALGGGAAIGLAKALADATSLPMIAVPTSFAGSALTDSYGVTHEAGKRVMRSERARARAALYDAALFDSFTGPAASASAFNAIAHAVDALFADIPSDMRCIARQAITRIAAELPRNSGTPADDIVEGAIGAARCLAAAGAGMHHRLCHIIGGRLGTPHAITHAVLLPYTVALRRESHPIAYADIAHALGVDDPAMALYRRVVASGISPGLAALGVGEDILPLLYPPIANAGVRDEGEIGTLLQRAWNGKPPIPA